MIYDFELDVVQPGEDEFSLFTYPERVSFSAVNAGNAWAACGKLIRAMAQSGKRIHRAALLNFQKNPSRILAGTWPDRCGSPVHFREPD